MRRRSPALVVALALVLTSCACNNSNGSTAPEGPEGTDITDTIEIGDSPSGIAVYENTVWVVNGGTGRTGTLSRVDTDTLDVTDTIDVGLGATDVAAADDGVWITNGAENTVSRVDPESLTVTDTIDVGLRPVGVAVSDEAAWVANSDSNTVSRVDLETRAVTDTIDIDLVPSGGMAIVDSGLWIAGTEDALNGYLVRLDLETLAVTDTIDIGDREGPAVGVAVSEDAMWTTNPDADATPDGDGGSVLRIDLDDLVVTDTIDLGGSPFEIAVSGGSVWVTNYADSTLSRIDPESLTVTHNIDVVGPLGVAVSSDAAWVTSAEDGTVLRIG